MIYLGLCTMCGPRGVSEGRLCPSCGSCIHICQGANANPCKYIPTHEALVELAGPVAAREFEQIPQDALKAETWRKIKAIAPMEDEVFLEQAESAIVAEAVLQNFRGNHASTYALTSAFYNDSVRRAKLAGHAEVCPASLYSRAHARVMRDHGHKGGSTRCTCNQEAPMATP